MNSRIEIYDSNGERAVIEAPSGREFNGDYYRPAIPFGSIVCETRPLPTEKEQRAEKLQKVIPYSNFQQDHIEEIEAIYAPYLKEPEC